MAGTKIQELTLEEVMSDRFGRYSKSIIQERALRYSRWFETRSTPYFICDE